MMKKLYGEVENLAKKEYELASQNFGATNNSSHESYAVLKEEMDEARDEDIQTGLWTERYWKAVKENDLEKQAECLKEVQLHALLAACEFIQTAAMAHKAMETINHTGSKTQQGET